MAPALPDDIYYALCEELALQEQFDTLFSCACSSRVLAIPALTHLYRYHHLAPVKGGGDDEPYKLATKQLMLQRWAILWRSIIASSLDATLFPYCRYIKTLDFRDLKNLLEDEKFKGNVSKEFFSGPLSKFNLTHQITIGNNKRKWTRLRAIDILDAVGDEITKHTPMLESISGELVSSALIRWAPRLPRLKALELYDGVPLEDELVHATIHEHCPQFNSLSIYRWLSEERDHKLSKFISAIRPQSLQFLEAITEIGASAETFLSLNTHSKSLKDLRLTVSNDSLPHLALLSGCTAVENLYVEDQFGAVNIEMTQNDVFLELISWLQKCSSLNGLSLCKFLSASALITPLLFSPTLKLRQIVIDPYIPKDSRLFHQALIQQRNSLQYLSLTGDTEGMFRDDIDILVDSLTQLTNLKELRLYLVQEVFHDEHLIPIFQSLPLLEDVYITGMEIKDEVLECVGALANLKSVEFSGISKFTLDGLLEFVERLGPNNFGIRIMVDMADPETLLAEEELELVKEGLKLKVAGRLEYLPYKDPNISEFEGDSD
ncbi:hypothetical protein B0J11DRAFT_501202 [Dendryphion nanum]|uniref:F-box domain-containing protein n=1 Tax=Dendryphion nanum TaxID=256645 RepID=A0A9P9EL03_9PLEO|nr:hypothetical protein B0J11DRAFT_501202 [Dendryphion nanum]